MVLITGATGILGRVIALYLVKEGRNVVATKRASSNIDAVRKSFSYYTEQPDLFFNKIKWIDVDFKAIEQVENALIGVTEVYHCAGYVDLSGKNKKEMFETNIHGTQNWLYACENSKVKKFCFVSSIAVLDTLNEEGFLDESSEYNPKLHHSSYAVSKHFSEMEVWRASAEGLDTVIINPGVILGSGNWGSSSGELFSSLSKLNYVTSGISAYVDVRDVAKIAIQLMNTNQLNERFVVVSDNKPLVEVAQIVRKKLNLSAPKVVSDRFINSLSFLSYLKSIFPIFSHLSKAGISMLTSKTTISNKKVKERLNYDFIPIEESLDFHLENYKKEKAANH